VLEGDIKACFDRISQPWLLKNIVMDKRMLHHWLKAGYWEKGQLFPTNEGTPQGGIISPLLANLALDGLEQAIRSQINRRHDQVNFIRYADDFIVTARTKEILERKVKPDSARLGQLSSSRLFRPNLLARGSYRSRSSAALGEANPPQQILWLAEAKVLQRRRPLGVRHEGTQGQRRKPGA
jgi:hypothetical protein